MTAGTFRRYVKTKGRSKEYVAKITHAGHQLYLGVFATPVEAALAVAHL
jgi:hypothetical protein